MKKMYKKPSTEQMNVQPANIIATSLIVNPDQSTDQISVPTIEAD